MNFKWAVLRSPAKSFTFSDLHAARITVRWLNGKSPLSTQTICKAKEPDGLREPPSSRVPSKDFGESEVRESTGQPQPQEKAGGGQVLPEPKPSCPS